MIIDKDLSATLEMIKKYTTLEYPVFLETDPKKFIGLAIDTNTQRQKWCEENCQGEWIDSVYIYFFEQEGDALAFKLRWL